MHSSFFESVDRIAKPEYIPSPQDILAVRIRSATFEQATYNYKETQFRCETICLSSSDLPTHDCCHELSRVWDIGGQIPERKKWRRHMVAATALIVFVSLVDYDRRFVGFRNTASMQSADFRLVCAKLIN
jgi:guanine nucleotide-binding protein G(i) subunit alpha